MAKDERTGGGDPKREELDERGIGSADDVRGIAGDEGDEEIDDSEDLDEEDLEDDESESAR